MAERVYVVTDIEVDGFTPGASSMLSFGSVAVTAAGEQVGEFEAVLEPLPGAQPHPETWSWWQSQPPEVLAAATADPQPVPKAWFGDVPHTHRAIDDARGYANLLVEVMRRGRAR